MAAGAVTVLATLAIPAIMATARGEQLLASLSEGEGGLTHVTYKGTNMAATPEAKTKAKVRLLLSKYDGMYSYWPVPSGYGKTTLDVLGCYRGRFFTIETKAPGKKPTLRQMEEIAGIEAAMGCSFIIAGVDSSVLEDLKVWLDHLSETVPYDPNFSPDQVRRRFV